MFGRRPVANITRSTVNDSRSDSSTQKPCSTFSTPVTVCRVMILMPRRSISERRCSRTSLVETAQNVLPAIDQRHLRAEPVENTGELDRDIAAALDENALRQLFEVERLV